MFSIKIYSSKTKLNNSNIKFFNFIKKNTHKLYLLKITSIFIEKHNFNP